MAFNLPLFGKRQDRVDELVEALTNKYGSDNKDGSEYIWENNRTKITLTPETKSGTISIYYESLVKSNNSNDY